MGLDMTLVKFVKVAGLEAKDYGKAANRIMPKTESGGIAFVDFEAEGFLAGSNALNISSSFLEGDSRFPMLGIQVGYWRKANAIHKWFVEHVQGGVDDCGYYLVQKSDLTVLRIATVKALEALGRADYAACSKALPTQDGFFFGSADYGDWYHEDLTTTLDIIDGAMLSVDWANEVLIYHSSW
jgi:hypothetical protein